MKEIKFLCDLEWGAFKSNVYFLSRSKVPINSISLYLKYYIAVKLLVMLLYFSVLF